MKKIAIITQGVKINEEKGYTRFAYIADILARQGFQVELITSTFQHWEKKQRNINGFNHDFTYKMKFIYEPGYKKNIDLTRIISHKILAQNLKKYLKTCQDFDLIYFEIPPNDVARAAVSYAKERNIPAIADINDLWPEAMKMVIDIPFISNFLFFPFMKDAEWVYQNINGIIGTSQEYADRPIKNGNYNIPRKVVYVGIDLKEFDDGVKEYSNQIQKDQRDFWVMYAGTIGTSYDIKTIILSAVQLKKKGYQNIKIKLLGDGPLRKKLEKMAESLDCNVEFLGYVPYKKMAAYLTRADLLINSFVKKAPQSIVTNVGDYLASGNPMINTCSSREFCKKVKSDRFGINIEPENTIKLTQAIEIFYHHPKKRAIYGSNARVIAEKEFNREKAYLTIVDLVNNCLMKKK